ncbi:MAG: glycosyltransferase [Bacteroidales bacterium]|nr:glycosyltransferase [Bacteroidales bacterium]
MKFLIVAPRFHTNLYFRAKALQDAGHIVKIVTLYKGQSEFYEELKPKLVKLSKFSDLILKIFSFFKKGKLKSSFEMRFQAPDKEFKKIINNYKPEVILLKAYQNALAIKTLRIAKKHGIKVLMLTQTPYNHIKGSEFLFQQNIKLFKFLKVYAYITPIKINYEVFKNSGIKNVYYLPFVYPVNNVPVKIIKDEIRILSIGKFQKRKDQLLLLKVVKQLVNEHFLIKLCLIGELADEKYFNTLNKFIKDNLLDKIVCIKTNMPYPEIQQEFKKHDLFVLPAYNEPAAYSPVEAMANALPVICSDENGTKCYIEKAKNGYIFKARDEKDLYEKIKFIISDKENLLQMKKNALLSAKENHNPQNYAKEIIKICDFTKYNS